MKGENLMVGSHKSSNETYRNNYDMVFKKAQKEVDGLRKECERLWKKSNYTWLETNNGKR